MGGLCPRTNDVDTTKYQVIKQMRLCTAGKIHNTRYGDFVPLVTSNALNTSIVILEKYNSEHDVHIVQPRECIKDCT